MVTNFGGSIADVEIYNLHSLLWRSAKKLRYCQVNVRFNSGDGAATSCKYLVNFSPVTRDSATFANLSSHGTLAFQSGLQYRDPISAVLCNCSLLFRNLVRFESEYPGVYDVRLCAAEVDHFTDVSLATFATF